MHSIQGSPDGSCRRERSKRYVERSCVGLCRLGQRAAWGVRAEPPKGVEKTQSRAPNVGETVPEVEPQGSRGGD